MKIRIVDNERLDYGPESLNSLIKIAELLSMTGQKLPEKCKQ